MTSSSEICRRRFNVAVAMAVLLLVSDAQAKDVEILGRDFTFAATNTFNYTYRFDDGDSDPRNDKYHQVYNSLNLDLSTGDVRLGLRLDLYAFANRPAGTGAGTGRYENAWPFYTAGARYPDSVYLVLAKPAYDLTLGNFYASFGKGLALNIVKVDALGMDTTLRGGKFVMHHDDTDLTLLAGVVQPLIVDDATGYKAPWTEEPILGARLAHRFFETILLGAHVVWVARDRRPRRVTSTREIGVERTDQNLIWGGGVELPSLLDGKLNIAAEVDLQRTIYDGEVTRGPGAVPKVDITGKALDEGFAGLAAYTTATLTLGDTTITHEFKHYEDFLLMHDEGGGISNEPYDLLYHQPPTLERIDETVSDNVSTTGSRLRVDYDLGEISKVEVLVFGSYAMMKTRAYDTRHTVHDPYGGFELTWGDGLGHLNVTAGVRFEYDDRAGERYRRDIFHQGDFEQAFAKRHTVKFSWVYRRRGKSALVDFTQWTEFDTALEYKWSPAISATFTVEMSSDKAAVADEGFRYYFGGSLRYYLDAASYLQVRIGENRPGFKCANGNCRWYPGFSGLRVGFVSRL